MLDQEWFQALTRPTAAVPKSAADRISGVRALQVTHLVVVRLDLGEFALDRGSDWVRKLFVDHNFLENLLYVVLARLDGGYDRRIVAGHLLLEGVEPSFGGAERGPPLLGIAAVGLNTGLQTLSNFVSLGGALEEQL